MLLPGLLDRLLYTALLLRGVRLTDAALPLLQLTQSVSQAAPPAAELLQLPHLTPPTAAALGGAVGGHTLAHLLATPREARAEALRAAGLRAEQRDDVEAFLRLFPRAEVSVAWGVEGEEAEGGRVRARDVVTFRVTLALPHRQELRAVGARLPAHAPRFPHARPEAWVVLLCEPGGGGVLAVAAMPPAVLRGGHTAKLTVRWRRTPRLPRRLHAPPPPPWPCASLLPPPSPAPSAQERRRGCRCNSRGRERTRWRCGASAAPTWGPTCRPRCLWR